MTPLTLVHLGRYSHHVHIKTVFCQIFRVRVKVNLDHFIWEQRVAAHIWCRYTHTHTHTICKKGCILIEYLVHLFVHVLVSLESSLCFSWLFSGFQKEEGEEEADSRNNISFN